MEFKMTSRDKMLLIILAIILVVFGAVMLPTYGIKDTIVAINDAKDSIKVQKMTNEEALTKLTEQGISAAYAENAGQAKSNLKKQILMGKYGAVKLQQNNLSSKSYAVAREWLLPVKYWHFDAGSNVQLLASVAVSQNEGGFVSAQMQLSETLYQVNTYTCMLSFAASEENQYTLQYEFLNTDTTNVGALSLLIAMYNVLQERGSISVKGWNFDEGGIKMELELTVPGDNAIADYAAEIGECHHCGNPYYLSDYDWTKEAKCSKCDNPITEEALN